MGLKIDASKYPRVDSPSTINHYSGPIGEFDFDDGKWEVMQRRLDKEGNHRDYLRIVGTSTRNISIPEGLKSYEYLFYNGSSEGTNFNRQTKINGVHLSEDTICYGMFGECNFAEGFDLFGTFDLSKVKPKNLSAVFSRTKFRSGFILDLTKLNLQGIINQGVEVLDRVNFEKGSYIKVSNVSLLRDMLYANLCHCQYKGKSVEDIWEFDIPKNWYHAWENKYPEHGALEYFISEVCLEESGQYGIRQKLSQGLSIGEILEGYSYNWDAMEELYRIVRDEVILEPPTPKVNFSYDDLMYKLFRNGKTVSSVVHDVGFAAQRTGHFNETSNRDSSLRYLFKYLGDCVLN